MITVNVTHSSNAFIKLCVIEIIIITFNDVYRHSVK